ncbi:MAG: NTP transferase domain-containing protein [Spirochaetes bacterium]|nr:NTP transferase domain-containing protein [Spirochaetota bacterium]
MEPVLLVLAAGMGSRFGGLKQIVPIGENGETIIDYSIFDAVRAGFSGVYFVIRKDIEKEFREVIGRKYEKRINVEYIFQDLQNIPENFQIPHNRTKPWGTGHAILCAGTKIKGPFAVINGDDFYGSDAFQVLADYFSNTGDVHESYAIVAYILKNTLSDFGTVSRGVCSLDQNDSLENIIEHTNIQKSGNKIQSTDNSGHITELTGNEYVSMNLFGFNKTIFDHLSLQFTDFLHNNIDNIKSEFYIPTVVNNLIKSGHSKVKVLQSKSKWLGITYQEDKEHVINKIKELTDYNEYPKNLWL